MNNPKSRQSFKHEIIDHYNTYDESERLKTDIGPLELVRTKELILRFLPPPPAIILDVGGASGVYSFWLASLGYPVHLVDLVPRHIEQAMQISQKPSSPKLASMKVGDARKLDFPAEFADVVLMHGPLYHLPDREDRLSAIKEAKRVLRPGSMLLAFAITRFAGLIYGLLRGYVFDQPYHRMIKNEVRTGYREDPQIGCLQFHKPFFTIQMS